MNNFLFKKIIQFFLKWMAKIYIFKRRPFIVAITGTTGRFWVKEKIIEAMKEKNCSFRASEKNFNAEIGVPLSVLGLPSGEGDFYGWLKVLRQGFKNIFSKNTLLANYLVLEMAISKPDNMKYLLSIIKPNILILTTVTMIYQENFEDLDKIAYEYKLLVEKLSPKSVLILNNDDERIIRLKNYFSGKTITYGFSEKADYVAFDIEKISTGQIFKVKINNKKEDLTAKINRFGKHHITGEIIKKIFINENLV